MLLLFLCLTGEKRESSNFVSTFYVLFGRHVPGMMATSALDETVTIWDTYNASNGKSSVFTPMAKINKNMKVGKLFTLNFYPSSPWLMGCGGNGKEIALWDMASDVTIQKCFGGRSKAPERSKDDVINEQSEIGRESILDAVMTSDSNNQTIVNDRDTKKSLSSNKKKKKKKKKAHRAGR